MYVGTELKTDTVNVDVILRSHYFAQKNQLECQFSFFIFHLFFILSQKNADDGRWAHILHLFGYREKKAPRPGSALLGVFRQVGMEFFWL